MAEDHKYRFVTDPGDWQPFGSVSNSTLGYTPSDEQIRSGRYAEEVVNRFLSDEYPHLPVEWHNRLRESYGPRNFTVAGEPVEVKTLRDDFSFILPPSEYDHLVERNGWLYGVRRPPGFRRGKIYRRRLPRYMESTRGYYHGSRWS